MNQWQTTVKGRTWDEIVEAADRAAEQFFVRPDVLTDALARMTFDIDPGEIIVTRDGFGVVCYEVVEYEATVTVKF